MLSEDGIKTARNNFVLASEDFHFEFESPFTLTDELSVFGYIPNYGSKNGVVICLTSPPDFQIDKKVVDWCNLNDFCYSFLNIDLLVGKYNRSLFRDMLRDWGKY